jgi:hypothetical protein
MSLPLLSVFVLVAVLAPPGTPPTSVSAIAAWTRVEADGTTLANSVSVSGSHLIARIRSSDGSVTTDSGPLTDINMLAATICTHPQVRMVSIGLKSGSFHEVSNSKLNPANFYEESLFLQFGDVQTEKHVARVLSALTGIAVQYYTDCTSKNLYDGAFQRNTFKTIPKQSSSAAARATARNNAMAVVLPR